MGDGALFCASQKISGYTFFPFSGFKINPFNHSLLICLSRNFGTASPIFTKFGKKCSTLRKLADYRSLSDFQLKAAFGLRQGQQNPKYPWAAVASPLFLEIFTFYLFSSISFWTIIYSPLSPLPAASQDAPCLLSLSASSFLTIKKSFRTWYLVKVFRTTFFCLSFTFFSLCSPLFLLEIMFLFALFMYFRFLLSSSSLVYWQIIFFCSTYFSLLLVFWNFAMMLLLVLFRLYLLVLFLHNIYAGHLCSLISLRSNLGPVGYDVIPWFQPNYWMCFVL